MPCSSSPTDPATATDEGDTSRPPDDAEVELEVENEGGVKVKVEFTFGAELEVEPEVELEVVAEFEVDASVEAESEVEAEVKYEIEVELKLDVEVGDEIDSGVEVEAELEVIVGAEASFFPRASSLCCFLNLAFRAMLSDFCWTFLYLARWLCAKPVQHEMFLDTIQRRSCKMRGMIWSLRCVAAFSASGEASRKAYGERRTCTDRGSAAGTP